MALALKIFVGVICGLGPFHDKSALGQACSLPWSRRGRWQNRAFACGLCDKMLAERGHKVSGISQEDVAKWKDMQIKLADDWASLMVQQGRAGKVVLDAYPAAQ